MSLPPRITKVMCLLPALISACIQLPGYTTQTAVYDASQTKNVGGNFNALAFSPDSHFLAAGTLGGVMIFDLDTGLSRDAQFKWRGGGKYRPKGYARSLTYSPDGQFLAAAGMDESVIVWESDTLEEVETFRDFASAITVAFTPDSRHLAMGNLWGGISIVDMQDPDNPTKLQSVGSAVTCLAFSADGGVIVAGTEAGSIRIWEWQTGEEVATFETDQGVSDCELSYPHRRLVALAGERIIGWQLATNEEAYQARVETPETVGEHIVFYGVVVPVVTLMYTIAGGGGGPCFDDCGPNNVWTMNLPRMALSPDGDFVVAVREQPGVEYMFAKGFTQLIKIDTGEVTATVAEHAYEDIAFSPDGQYLGLVTTKKLHLYNAQTFEEIDFEEISENSD